LGNSGLAGIPKASGPRTPCVVGYDGGFLIHEEAAPMFRSNHRHFKPEPFWRNLIGRWNASGQSVAAFCAANRVSQANLYSWRKRLATGARPTTLPAPTFAPVRKASAVRTLTL
jgi:hypothetical protein